MHFEVEQFYFHEAELLDDGRYADWLDLLADDLDYWMPTRTNRLRRQQALSIAARGRGRVLRRDQGEPGVAHPAVRLRAWPGPRTRRHEPGTW